MNTLASFSQSDSFLRTKLSMLTFYGARYSNWSEKLLVILEYLQLISQGLLIYPSAADQQSTHTSGFTTLIIYILKLVNPSSLMKFQSGGSTNVILLIVLSSMLLKYLLATYVVYIAYRNRAGNSWLLSIWKWIFRRQGRILYFLTTSFWTYLILNYSSGTFEIKGLGKTAVVAVSGILIAIEYIFSVILELGFSYVLPTKNFLSSKSYRTVMITLNQKLVLQIVQLASEGHVRICLWIFAILNLTFNLIRTYQYYAILPLYNLRALLFQGYLLNAVTSLSIVGIFHNILQEADYQEENAGFIVVVWIITSLLAGKLSRAYILKQIKYLLTRPSRGTVEKLLHKIVALKQLRKWKNETYDIIYLISTTGEINLQNVFSLREEPYIKLTSDLPDLGTKENYNDIYLQYLENLSAISPNKALIKLHIAKLCSKEPELYPKAINIISSLARKKWSDSFLSASLLRYEIEKTVMKSHRNDDETTLDLLTYIKNQIHIDKLTDGILTQTELKIAICNNILGEKANIGLIFNNAHLIDKYKAQIQKQIDQLPQIIQSCFIEPHLICAGYYLILNDSPEGYVKCNELHLQKQFKHEKTFKEIKLNKENLYQNTTAFLILSGEKSNKGQIVYSSQSLENICGGKQISYNRAHISTLFTMSFQPFYSEALRQIFEIEKEISLDQAKEVFLQHKDGHMVHAEVYFKIHPYLTQGLYLDMIIRPVPSSKEYLILTEDGTIEGMTRKLANHLGIKNSLKSSSTRQNIRVISEELSAANQAFNTIIKEQNDIRLTEQGDSTASKLSDNLGETGYKKALNLHKSFSGVQRIQLKSLKPVLESANNEENTEYDCNISMIQFGPTLSKLITLEKIGFEMGEDGVCGSIDIEKYIEQYTTWKTYKEDQKNKVDDESANVDLTESENIESPERIEDERPPNTFRRETSSNTDGNLVSITARGLTDRPLLFKGREEDRNTDSPRVQANNVVLGAMPAQGAQKMLEVQMNPLSSNQPNSSSQYRTATTTFRTALAIDFRPKSFTAICLMFYAVIFITFMSQVVLKVVSDDLMETLTIKKNLLTYSQLRTFRVFLIATNARVGVTTITSTSLDFGLVYDLPTTIVSLKNQTDFLQDFNERILEYASFLDEDVQHELFLPDVKVYDFQLNDLSDSPYRTISQFQVIDETVEKIYKLRKIADPHSNEALDLFFSLRYNLVDDFLYKCELITNLLTQSVQDEREYLELIISLFLIVIPVLLVGIILMVTAIIWKQYIIERRNMLAFIRLKPSSVKDILDKLKSFKKNLQNKDYREYEKTIEFDEHAQVPRDDAQSSSRKHQDDQVINYSEMRTRYSGYFLKVTFYVLILIGIMVGNFISAEKANKDVYNKQNQIHFANKINEIAGVQYTAFEDAFQTNNSARIKHWDDPLALWLNLLDELKGLQSQIPEVFLEVDRTYDPEVESHLFENYCSQYTFTGSVYYLYCNLIRSWGQRVNLVSLISYYQDIMQGKLQDYYKCDNSTLDSLYKCLYIRINVFMSAWVLLMGETFSLGALISNKLEQSIADANYQRNVFLIVFSVSLVAASILIWYQILAKLKEGYNDFKKVLQLFPPAVILSSFQLKTFLLQHSKQIRK